MATAVWIKQAQGLANRIDPARIQYNPKTGVVNYSEAYNVNFDITGAFSRRKGFSATNITTSCHSLFDTGSSALLVSDTRLYTLTSSLVSTSIRTNLTLNLPMSYCQVGDSILYMNGAQSGVVRDGVSYGYEMPPNARYPDSTRVYNNPPVGTIIKLFSGRVYIASGSVLWYSEPFGPNLFRAATNYIPFPAEIIMVAPVVGGIFVSTTKKIYFFAGKDVTQFQQSVVAHYPAIKGTDCEVDGIAVRGGKISPAPMQMFTTTMGICVGTADGQLVNLTFEELDIPVVTVGCAVYTGKKYIVSFAEEEYALCMNLGNTVVSEFGNYNFKGICKFGDLLLGGNENGLFKLDDGDTDGEDNISAWVKTGPTDFGVEEEKRLRKVYVSYRTNGSMKMSIEADGKDGIFQEIIASNTDLAMIHQKVSGGRDIRGKYLDLKLENMDGADFLINEVKAVLIILSANTVIGS